MAKKEKEAKEAKEPKEKEVEGKASSKDEAPKAKGGKLKLIIIVVLAMVVGGGGAFAVMKFVLTPAQPVVAAESGKTHEAVSEDDEDFDEEEPIVAPSKGKSEKKAEEPAEHGEPSGGHGEPSGGHGEGGGEAEVPDGPQTVELKPFTTNLIEPTGRRFLKIIIGMEVDNQAAADELNKKMPDIRDSILILLSSLASEDISTADGKERLRNQILNRTNGFMNENRVRKVKYSEFIIQ